MKTLNTLELTGDDLLAAVALALRTSYDAFSAEVRQMDFEQLQAYLKLHPEINVDDEARDSPARLQDLILGSHEPLLPGEEDLRIATEEDLWPLCEYLLDRYDIDLCPRYPLRTNRKIWLADEDNLRVSGDSPKQAILRYYVKLKLGAEVTLDA